MQKRRKETARSYIAKNKLKWQDYLTPEEQATLDRLFSSQHPYDRRKWKDFRRRYQTRATARMIEHVQTLLEKGENE